LTLSSRITPTGQRFLQKYSLGRNWNGSDLLRSLVPLLKVEERVGKVDNVFMAVDVGHGSGSKVEEEE